MLCEKHISNITDIFPITRYAIAEAVLNNLSKEVGCLTLFATHYHMLTRDVADNPLVGLYHMACFVDEERYNHQQPWLSKISVWGAVLIMINIFSMYTGKT